MRTEGPDRGDEGLFFGRLGRDLAILGALLLPLGIGALAGFLVALTPKAFAPGVICLALGVFNMIALALLELSGQLEGTLVPVGYQLAFIMALVGYAGIYLKAFGLL
ncbi:hypothetical protein [Peptococcus simiae]|uniref:hypothetical protein n=1 Tax=Peptococcus simiae TaxID=1643805 RepID=UPI0039818188